MQDITACAGGEIVGTHAVRGAQRSQQDVCVASPPSVADSSGLTLAVSRRAVNM